MGHIKVYLNELKDLIDNLEKTAHNTDVYANNLRNDNISTLSNIEGGCSEHITDAVNSIREKADSMNGTSEILGTTSLVDRMGIFQSNLKTFKENVETVDGNVKNQLSLYGTGYREENNIQTSWWEDLKYTILNGIHSKMNDSAFGRVVSELCRNVKDWFTDRWEDIKEWYAFDGGEFICNIALAGLAIVASIFTIWTAGVGFLAVVAVVASVCAIIDAVAKIIANTDALLNNNSDPAWARKLGKATSLSTFGDTLVDHDADSGWGKTFQFLGSINDVVSTVCAVIQFTDFATKSLDKFTGKTSAFQKYLGSGGVFDTAFIKESGTNTWRKYENGTWYKLKENGDFELDKLGNKVKVDFSTKNKYSVNAKWSFGHGGTIDTATSKTYASNILKNLKEDGQSIIPNAKSALQSGRSYLASFSGNGFKGNAIKILKDTGSTIKTLGKNYFRNDDGVLKHIKSVLKPNASAVFGFSDTAKKVPYMRGQNNNFSKILVKISYVGTQINNGVTAATQGLNIATGHFKDNWDTTSKWNKMVKGIDNVSDRKNKTLDTYTIHTSTRYNNLNYLFN